MLLLCQIAGLTIERATNQSSSAAPRNLHKVLCQLLILNFVVNNTALFSGGLPATDGRSLVCVLLGRCLLDHYAASVFVLSSHGCSSEIYSMVLVDTTMATFWAWRIASVRWEFIFRLLCHTGSHKGFRIWNGPTLLTASQIRCAVLLQLWCIYRLIYFVTVQVLTWVEVWVSVSICSNQWIIKKGGLSVRNSTSIYRLISSIIIVSLSRIVLCCCYANLPNCTPCRLWILLPRIQAQRSSICEVRINFLCSATIVMKLNVLVHRAHRAMVRNAKVACSGRQDVNRVWIKSS